MTTIAANLECMAADRKVTRGDTRHYAKKLRRVGDAIVGAAGSSAGISKFVKWLEAGADDDDIPKLGKDEDFEAIVLSKDGLTFYEEDFQADPMADEFAAIGTGVQAALAAMLLGHTPEAAIEVAKQTDNNTGGAVDVMWLDERKMAG